MPKADDLLAWLVEELRSRQRDGDPVSTLGWRRPHWIARIDGDGVWVETNRSRGDARLVRQLWLRDSVAELVEEKTLCAEDLPGSARYRSAFLLTVLSLLPGASPSASPPCVAMRD
jgi:hypothetical protein